MHREHGQSEHRGHGKGILLAFIAGAATVLVASGIMMRKGKTRSEMRMESWALRARSEILRRMADAEDMSEREFGTIVELVTTKYGEAQRISKEKIAEIRDELRSRWQELKDTAAEAKRTAEADMDDEGA